MIITISGTPGSGKSTVGPRLAHDLGFERIYAGGIRREVAKKLGMTIEEFNTLGEKEDFTDKEVDEYLRKLGQEKDNLVIEGRTAFHFIPNSFKVFLDVEPRVGAERIYKQFQAGEGAERNEQAYASVEEAMQKLRERCECDARRYIKYYGLDCYDKSKYDLVIDTTNKSTDDVMAEIKANLPER